MTAYANVITVGAAILAGSYLFINFRNAEKLKLKIQKFEKEIGEQESTCLTLEALDAIADFTSTNPSAHDTRHFLQLHPQLFEKEGCQRNLTKEAGGLYVAALQRLEKGAELGVPLDILLVALTIQLFAHAVVKLLSLSSDAVDLDMVNLLMAFELYAALVASAIVSWLLLSSLLRPLLVRNRNTTFGIH